MADRVPRAAIGIAWVIAGVAAIVLYASARGDGTGILGSGALRHPLWTYAIFLAVIAVGLWIVNSARPTARAARPPPSAEREAR